MTRQHSTEKDNPATDPARENGQGKHDGIPHSPEEFLKADSEIGKDWPAKPRGAKEDAMAKDPYRTTYPAEMEDERKDPDGTGHNKPKPSDAPSSTVSTNVGKKNRVVPD